MISFYKNKINNEIILGNVYNNNFNVIELLYRNKLSFRYNSSRIISDYEKINTSMEFKIRKGSSMLTFIRDGYGIFLIKKRILFIPYTGNCGYIDTDTKIIKRILRSSAIDMIEYNNLKEDISVVLKSKEI